jgi:hypothetical protein
MSSSQHASECPRFDGIRIALDCCNICSNHVHHVSESPARCLNAVRRRRDTGATAREHTQKQGLPMPEAARRPYQPRPHRRARRTESGIPLPRSCDGRTIEMRRLRQLTEALELEFSVVAESERGSIQQLATVTLLLEQMQPAIVEGRCADADTIIRLSGERRRLLSDLRGKAAQRHDDGPTELDRYLAETYGSEPDAEVIETT